MCLDARNSELSSARTASRVHLGLGSNLGDRMRALERALDAIGRLPTTSVTRRSRVYETLPEGVVDQPLFLNMAAEIETALAPLALLEAAKRIERAIGRRPGLRWGPRAIDIDLILWGPRIVREPALEIPHRAFRERAFVLALLAEIAGEAVDPVTGRTVAELAAATPFEGRVALCPQSGR